jgi:NDP-4-keto-2,6-dideoxyhexose 3-C-methyltransferase
MATTAADPSAQPVPVDRCRVCGNTRLYPVLDLGAMALTGRFFGHDEARPPSWPVTLLRCDNIHVPDACGTAQLLHDYDQTQFFGPFYGYRSGITETMRTHLKAKADELAALTRLGAGDVVIDIGSNDGTLLAAYDVPGIDRIGVDPSAEPFRDAYPPGAELVVDFFPSPRLGRPMRGRKARVVTSIAMFYDVPDPVGFARAVRDLLAPDGVWEVEVAYFPRIVEILGYDTIVHEHATFYALANLQWIGRQVGLEVFHAEESTINGASLRVLFRHAAEGRYAETRSFRDVLAFEEASAWRTRDPVDQFALRVFAHRDAVQRFFAQCRARRLKVLGYGASTKGNAVLQFCGVGRADMPFILERYPKKYGLLTPGTEIPIIPEEAGRAMRPDVLAVLPWQFRDEIVRRERAWIEAGGALFFAVPELEVVTRDGVMPAEALFGR